MQDECETCGMAIDDDNQVCECRSCGREFCEGCGDPIDGLCDDCDEARSAPEATRHRTAPTTDELLALAAFGWALPPISGGAPEGEIWGFCYGCRQIRPLAEGPGFKLATHADKDGIKCSGSGSKAGYICSPPDPPPISGGAPIDPQAHTPGPWEWSERNGNVTTADGKLLLLTGVSLTTGNHSDQKEADANARLIAAAPDLLAACLAMLGTWGGQDEDVIIRARDMAQHAISKAIG